MRAIRAFLRRLGGFFRRERWEADLDAELNSNLEHNIEDNIRDGMSPQQARRAALLRFGRITAAKDQYRDRKLIPWLDDLFRDVRYSARSLARSKAFSLTVIATLALCIGANATVLSALYSVVFKPLPVKDPERLVQLFNLREARNPDNPYSESGWVQYLDLRERTYLFEGVTLRSRANRVIRTGSSVSRVKGQWVTAEFFDLMGAEPLLGRFFLREEVEPGPGHVVVLSQTWWENGFDADPDVVGEQIVFGNDVPYTIIGVAPRSMEAFDYEARFTIPYNVDPRSLNPARGRYNAHGDDLWLRLQPGVTRQAALDQVRAIERDWFENIADSEGRRLYQAYQGRVRFDLPHPLEGSLYFLEGGSLFVFLTGCFNVMILFLSRVHQKRQELSIRQAIGAEMLALRRLTLVESALLAGAAALAGTGIAWAGTSVLNRYLARLSPKTMPIEIDAAVLAAILAVSIAIVGVMNLVPLEILWRAGLLRRVDGSQRTSSKSAFSAKLSSAMIVGQVAIAFVMLIGAGLLFNSFRNVLAVDPGFQASQVVEGRLDFATVRAFYSSRDDAGAVKRRIYDALAGIPGVESVGFSMFPMFGNDMRSGGANFLATGAASPQPQGHAGHIVSPSFFAAMGIAILEGRACNSADSEFSVVVDELFVQRFFDGRSPIGLEIEAPPASGLPNRRVIGVSGRANLRGQEQRDGQPIVYSCEPVDRGWWEYSILLRTTRPAAPVIREMEQKLREIDPRLPLSYSGSLQGALDDMLVSRQAITMLLTCFAALALLLSLIGVYAVLANNVVERRREIGIRFALGARSQEIYRLILKNGLGKTLTGLAMGIVGAAILSRFLTRFLFDVASFDPLTYIAVTALFLAAAFAACVLPARRANGIPPVEALKME